MKKNNSRRLLLVAVALLGAVGLVVFSAAASVLAYRQFVGNDKEEANFALDNLLFDDGNETVGQGVLILHVDPGSPAEQSGLSSGTIILSVNGRPVNSPQELKDVIAGYEVGDTVTLTIKNGEATEEIALTLGDSGPYLGVRVGPGDGGFHLRGDQFVVPEENVIPGLPGHPHFDGGPDVPEGMMPFEFHFDEFDFDPFGGEHGHFFDLFGESALVMSVEEDSPAAQAGIMAGDAIVEANGHAIKDSQELIDLVADLSPGDVLTLQVQRGDETISLEVTLTSHPEDSDRAFLGVFLAPGEIPREMEFFQERQNS